MTDNTHRHEGLVDEFCRHEGRKDGERIAQSLSDGFTLLRDLLYLRIHQDVEQNFGMDSMLVPVSETKSESRTKTEIEIFQIAVCASEAKRRSYVTDEAWFAEWLTRLRFRSISNQEKVDRRISKYLGLDLSSRRLAFEKLLGSVMPESRKTPLVLFRLFPLSVGLATAVAFGDRESVAELHAMQCSTLPAIPDCSACGGNPMENGDYCDKCGNPVWNFTWLTDADS